LAQEFASFRIPVTAVFGRIDATTGAPNEE